MMHELWIREVYSQRRDSMAGRTHIWQRIPIFRLFVREVTPVYEKVLNILQVQVGPAEQNLFQIQKLIAKQCVHVSRRTGAYPSGWLCRGAGF